MALTVVQKRSGSTVATLSLESGDEIDFNLGGTDTYVSQVANGVAAATPLAAALQVSFVVVP